MTVCHRKFEKKLAELQDPEGSELFALTRLLVDGIFPRESHEPFIDDHLIKLAAAIKTNTTLKTFNLGSIVDPMSLNVLAWTQAGITAIGEALKDHPAINRITVDISLTNSAHKVPTLQLLGLLKALTGKAKVKELYIKVNVTEDNFLNELAEALSVENSLEKLELEIDNANPDMAYPAAHWQNFANSLAKMTLKHFGLYSTRLGDEGMASLASALSGVGTLTRFELPGCGISSASANALSSILTKNKKLQVLRLDDNALADETITKLIPALVKMRALKYLSLRNTNLTYDSFTLLSSLLLMLNVEVLDINGHAFNDEVLKALNYLIEMTHSLRKLFVNSSFLTSRQTAFLSDPKKSKMREFHFLGPNEDPNGDSIAMMTKIFSYNPYVTSLGRRDLVHTFVARTTNHSRQKRMRQVCIDYLILLASVLNDISIFPGNTLTSLPRDLKLVILEFVLPVFMDIRLHDTWDLLLKNFSYRRSAASDWWSRGSIFRSRSDFRLCAFDEITAKVMQEELAGVPLTWINKRS